MASETSAFSMLLAISRLRIAAQPVSIPLEYCFDHHEAVRSGHVSATGQRLTLEVRSRRALDVTIIKSDTAKMTVRWGEQPGEWMEIEPGTGRMAVLGDLLEDAARGLDSVAAISAAAGATASALRSLPLPATIIFEDPLAHTRIFENSEVNGSLLRPVVENYERSWDEICDVGLAATYSISPVPITSLPEARAALAPLIKSARRIVAFTGAGVSVESGVPSYRGCGPASLWSNFSEEDASLPAFRRDPTVRSRYWEIKTYFYSIILQSEPNPAHKTLGKLATEGRLHAVVTQNIDGLHERGGVPVDKVINLHGTEGKVKCDGCGKLAERQPVHEALFIAAATPPVQAPTCDTCGALIRPTTIMFGQELDASTLAQAHKVCDEADLMLVLGTSLVVQPANKLPTQCIRRRVPVVIVNPYGQTALDEYASLLLRVPAGALLDGLL